MIAWFFGACIGFAAGYVAHALLSANAGFDDLEKPKK